MFIHFSSPYNLILHIKNLYNMYLVLKMKNDYAVGSISAEVTLIRALNSIYETALNEV